MQPPSTALVRLLAPSGTLRAAINVGNPVLAQRAPEGVRGITVDLARHLAQVLQLPLQTVVFESAGKVTDAVAADRWDVAFLAVDPVRARELAFTQPYLTIEASFLVHRDAPFTRCADLDAAGRVIVTARGAAYDLHLKRELRHATMADAATPAESLAMFRQGSFDALAGVRQALARAAAEGPYRVLDDSFTQIRQAVALPKPREAALPWLREFVRDALRTGVIERGVRDSGQTDVSLASADPEPAG